MKEKYKTDLPAYRTGAAALVQLREHYNPREWVTERGKVWERSSLIMIEYKEKVTDRHSREALQAAEGLETGYWPNPL